MNAVMVAVKVGVIAIVIAGGIWFVQPAQLASRSFPPNTGTSASTAGAASCAARR